MVSQVVNPARSSRGMVEPCAVIPKYRSMPETRGLLPARYGGVLSGSCRLLRARVGSSISVPESIRCSRRLQPVPDAASPVAFPCRPHGGARCCPTVTLPGRTCPGPSPSSTSTWRAPSSPRRSSRSPTATQLDLPYRDLGDLRARYEFSDLQSFLDLYYANMTVLRTSADFETMTWAYAERAHRAGVRHAEVFVDPQAHTARGISCATVLSGVWSGLQRAESELGITSGIIVCILRDRPVAEARRTLEDCLATDVPLLGLGLDSAEVGYPPSLFAEVFAVAAAEGACDASPTPGKKARRATSGKPSTCWGPSASTTGCAAWRTTPWCGGSSTSRFPLTVCPLSNVRLRVIDELRDHPLRRMLDRGLLVTVNSDDPAYFGGYVDDNLRQCRSALGLSAAELDTLARNSIAASFAPAAAQVRTRQSARRRLEDDGRAARLTITGEDANFHRTETLSRRTEELCPASGTAANCSLLFTELPLLERPAAAHAAVSAPSSSGGRGRTSRCRPTPTSTPSSPPSRDCRSAADRAELLRRRPGRPGLRCAVHPGPRQRSSATISTSPSASGARSVFGAFNALYGNRVDGVRPRSRTSWAPRTSVARRPRRPPDRRDACWSSRSADPSPTRCAPPPT